MKYRATDFLRQGASRPLLMGVLNVTPDSFSDGGLWNSPEKAFEHAMDLVDQGADMIDVGGESTRPGADPVSSEEEMSRIIPVLKDISASVDVPISVDTMKASVAEAAVSAGADIINDVTGLSDPLMASVAASADVPVVIMYIHGTPKTFNTDFAEGNILDSVTSFLREKIDLALDAGVKRHNIITDPGVGFGTTHDQSMEIIRNSSLFGFNEYPVLIGPSRKRFLSKWYPDMERDVATAEVCRIASDNGADIVRVHNVKEVLGRIL